MKINAPTGLENALEDSWPGEAWQDPVIRSYYFFGQKPKKVDPLLPLSPTRSACRA